MFNFTTICESVKRHWIAIVLITALALVAGAGSSFVKSGKVETAATYTAEASLYVTGYGYDENARQGGDYNYEFNENTMMNDVRRIVVSKEVARNTAKISPLPRPTGKIPPRKPAGRPVSASLTLRRKILTLP